MLVFFRVYWLSHEVRASEPPFVLHNVQNYMSYSSIFYCKSDKKYGN